MLRTITRLLFGGQDGEPEQVKSGESRDDGWLLVSHPEAASSETHVSSADMQPPAPSLHENKAESNSCLDKEATGPPSRATVSSPPRKELSELTQVTSSQKAKGRTERHQASRNAIQRQNRRQHVPQQLSFHLQQPGQRSLSH